MDFASSFSFIEKIIPALVGFAGAWAGSRWGLTKFKKEKYWESKVKAYETTLSHFEKIAFWGRSNKAQAHCAVTVGDNDLHPQTFNESMRNLAQLEITAFVYFDGEFRDLIKEHRHAMESIYINEIEKLEGVPKESAYYKYADTQGKIGDMAYAALEVLNQQAHKDIGLKGHCCERLMVKITDDWREFRKNIQ
ncbi:hypothetical protein ACSN7N_000017 [Enterobacter hormaechei]|uniref:hypothetical protein n=1 Tax=Enterobacter cloacae complex TaxID=354276 RepID=UPI0007986775|nr:hypothetical protein [Enterobacter hormaechei]RTN68111.1 hypothetical protein EKN88_15900 [Enterobacter hormaechei]CZV59713.1 Uncharacterised protein [Enterobacter hormaechei]